MSKNIVKPPTVMDPCNPTKPKYGPEIGVGALRTIQYLGRYINKPEPTQPTPETPIPPTYTEEQEAHYRQLALTQEKQYKQIQATFLYKPSDNPDMNNGNKDLPKPSYRPHRLWNPPTYNPKPLFPFPITEVQKPIHHGQIQEKYPKTYQINTQQTPTQTSPKQKTLPRLFSTNQPNLTKIDLIQGLPQPGLGLENVELVGLLKEDIGLKASILVIDFSSPKDSSIRYGGDSESQKCLQC